MDIHGSGLVMFIHIHNPLQNNTRFTRQRRRPGSVGKLPGHHGLRKVDQMETGYGGRYLVAWKWVEAAIIATRWLATSGFKYIFFHPYLGKIPNLTNIFKWVETTN